MTFQNIYDTHPLFYSDSQKQRAVMVLLNQNRYSANGAHATTKLRLSLQHDLIAIASISDTCTNSFLVHILHLLAVLGLNFANFPMRHGLLVCY